MLLPLRRDKRLCTRSEGPGRFKKAFRGACSGGLFGRSLSRGKRKNPCKVLERREIQCGTAVILSAGVISAIATGVASVDDAPSGHTLAALFDT